MKKVNLKQLILGLVIVLGAILGILTLTGSSETFKKILGGLLITLVALFGAVSLMDSETGSDVIIENEAGLVMVTNVIDGDTIEVNDEAVVRLIGIDTPEQGECYYREAKEVLKDLILEKNVKLEKDVSGADKFGRLLRYVFLPSGSELRDDTFVNNYMVRYGYAKVMTMAPDHRYRSLFNASREQAINNKEGMWTECIDEMHNKELGEIGDPPPDPNCVIKGNKSLKEFGDVYFTPDCYNYEQVKINLDKGEKYFCSEQGAIDAGFRKSDTCP